LIDNILYHILRTTSIKIIPKNWCHKQKNEI